MDRIKHKRPKRKKCVSKGCRALLVASELTCHRCGEGQVDVCSLYMMAAGEAFQRKVDETLIAAFKKAK